MQEKLRAFLNSPLGSLIKVLIAVMLGHMLIEIQQGKTFFQVIHKTNWDNYLTIVVTSLIPVVINYVNGKDPRYGIRTAPKKFKPENNQIKP